MEAGKSSLKGDTLRSYTKAEVKTVKSENDRLKTPLKERIDTKAQEKV